VKVYDSNVKQELLKLCWLNFRRKGNEKYGFETNSIESSIKYHSICQLASKL